MELLVEEKNHQRWEEQENKKMVWSSSWRRRTTLHDDHGLTARPVGGGALHVGGFEKGLDNVAALGAVVALAHNIRLDEHRTQLGRRREALNLQSVT